MQVQRIKNDFTCVVYEIHGRIALEKVRRSSGRAGPICSSLVTSLLTLFPPLLGSCPFSPTHFGYHRATSANSISVKASFANCINTACQVTSWSFSATASCTCCSARIVQVRSFVSRDVRARADLVSLLLSTPALRYTELNATLASLTEAETADPSVSHALAVRLAVTQGNYTKLFRLFLAAPKMGAYIMDHFIERERVSALLVMSKA